MDGVVQFDSAEVAYRVPEPGARLRGRGNLRGPGACSRIDARHVEGKDNGHQYREKCGEAGKCLPGKQTCADRSARCGKAET